MSYEELDRVGVIERVIEKRLTQAEAARMLGLTSRQVRRLRRAYERDGPGGLVSRRRGRPSNRRLPRRIRPDAPGQVVRAEALLAEGQRDQDVHGDRVSLAPHACQSPRCVGDAPSVPRSITMRSETSLSCASKR